MQRSLRLSLSDSVSRSLTPSLHCPLSLIAILHRLAIIANPTKRPSLLREWHDHIVVPSPVGNVFVVRFCRVPSSRSRL